jgi:hypothetical protein
MITQARLKELFDYDPITGWLTNRISRNSRAWAGERAGTENERGYRQLYIGGIKYYEHRVIWLFVYGNLPDEIDHKDGRRNSNVLDNLREATRQQNCYNTDRELGVSALRGASFDSERSMWRSMIQVDGQSVFLGRFKTAEEAHRAYLLVAEHAHKEFAVHNRPEPLDRRI